jgi:hypothetical protein
MGRTTQVVDPIQALNRSLALREDRIIVKDKYFVSVSIGHGVPGASNVIPSFFGSRVASIASQYDRWRLLKFTAVPVSYAQAESDGGTFVTAIGINDDPDVAPTTLIDVINARCSAVFGTGISPSGTNMLVWNPVDPSKEYYCTLPSGSDLRLQSPCSVVYWYTGSATQTVAYLVYYTIEFVGSASVGGT